MKLSQAVQSSRIWAAAETTTLVIGFYFGIKALVLTPLPFWQYNLVGWDFNAHLVMIALPMLLIYLRGERPSHYGMQRGQLKDAGVRRLVIIVFIALPVLWFILATASVQFRNAHLILNLPPDWELKSWPAEEPWKTAVGVLLTVLFEIVSCGLGEEIMFRGYIQGRLNQVFDKPWKLRNTQFGWGLFFSALLFGFGHGLGFFNPFGESFGTSANFNFAWSDTIATAASGLIFGWLRERTNGIAVPAFLHALVGLVFGIVVLT